ncbi:MAG: UDP-N-acetylglucosamine 2-epimerase [Bacteroidota bacterium]
MNKLLLVFGTRPELIKLAPIVQEFRKRGLRERLFIVFTHQHPDIHISDLDLFKIDIDYQFHLDRENDSLTLLHGLLLIQFAHLKKHLKSKGVHAVALIAQGDTCTTFSASQFAFYEKIPLIHIEAGLRTGDYNEPFPEEYFRFSISQIASIHCAPNQNSQQQLIREGYQEDSIYVTGNTAIDNLRMFALGGGDVDFEKRNTVLVTLHRRENVNGRLAMFINRITDYAKRHPHKKFLWIDNPGYKLKDKIPANISNLEVIPPLSYREMIHLYKRTELIITDSGGIQEESTFLQIPTLIFRQKTEREESIVQGIAKYWDQNDDDLEQVIRSLSANKKSAQNYVFGDGFAAIRIVDAILEKGLIQ